MKTDKTEKQEIKTVDFCESFSAQLNCPYCGKDNYLDEGPSQYCEGEEYECDECGESFILGESLN